MKPIAYRLRRCLRGFTLIELLVVIAIILFLASMIYAVAMGAYRQVDRNKARSDVKALQTAIEAYYAAYLKYPSCASGKPTIYSDQLRDILEGGDQLTNGCNDVSPNGTGSANPKGIKFLTWQYGDSCWPNGYPKDPWGTPYNIYIDYNYDGRVDANDLTAGTGTSSKGFLGGWGTCVLGANGTTWGGAAVNKAVLVWSSGPNKCNDWGENSATASYDATNCAGKNRDDIASWQ